jgi:hypothetical protein
MSAASVPRAAAHEGPPFPIIVDQRAGPYLISVWTDPDVGVGTFYVILASARGAALPADNQVQVCVRPSSGRLPERCYDGTRQDVRDRLQYYAEVEFDQQEMWQVRVRVRSEAASAEVIAEVEATPPGFGAWDLLIYGFPFILFGLLWLCVALRSHRRRRSDAAPTGVPGQGPAK